MAVRSVTLSDNIGEFVTEFNLQANDIGDMALLTTSDTSSLVNALASLDSDLREQFGAVLDSAATIGLITNPADFSSMFNTEDFELSSGVVTLKDSAATFEIVDDTSTNSNFYITLTNQTSGFETELTVTSSKLSFNPSTGILDVSKVEADSATIATLNSTTAVINNLTNSAFTSDSATITTLNSTTSNIIGLTNTSLTSDSATIGNIAFTSMNGGDVNADSAYFTGVVNAQDFNSTSDRSLKDNIETLNDAINVLNKIRPVSFTWKKNNELAYGVIAQEIEEVLPTIVDEDKDNIKRVAYSQLIPFLVQVIQEQHKEIQNIKSVLDID